MGMMFAMRAAQQYSIREALVPLHYNMHVSKTKQNHGGGPKLRAVLNVPGFPQPFTCTPEAPSSPTRLHLLHWPRSNSAADPPLCSTTGIAVCLSYSVWALRACALAYPSGCPSTLAIDQTLTNPCMRQQWASAHLRCAPPCPPSHATALGLGFRVWETLDQHCTPAHLPAYLPARTSAPFGLGAGPHANRPVKGPANRPSGALLQLQTRTPAQGKGVAYRWACEAVAHRLIMCQGLGVVGALMQAHEGLPLTALPPPPLELLRWMSRAGSTTNPNP